MKLLERKYKATRAQKEEGRRIALKHGLPRIVGELPSGIHSYEGEFLVERMSGFKSVVDSMDTYGVVSQEKKRLEEKCIELGIIPVFKGDYITLDSFPRRNIIREEILSVVFRNGVKTIEKRSFFDILDYVKLPESREDVIQ